MNRRSLLSLVLLAIPFLPLHAQQQAQDPAPPAPRPDDEAPRLKPPPSQQSTNLTPTLLDRASATVSVITGQDLETLGVRTVTDALRIIPGLEVQKLSASESGVSVRSYSGPGAARQGILGLIDGRQVYNEFFGGVWWESLPITLDEIKKIEVIRGPSSFLYGPNAMHGLVNFVTKSPLDYGDGVTSNHEFFLSASAGSYDSNVETLTYVKREGLSGVKVTMAHDDMDQFEGGRDTRNKLFADIRFETQIDEDQRFELSAGASREKFDVFFPKIVLDVPILPTGKLTLFPATYTTRATEYFLKGNYSFLEGLKIQISWTHLVADGQPDALYMPFSLSLDTGDVDVQYSLTPFDSNRVTVGTGYRYTTFATHDFDVANGRHATGLSWFFLQDELTVAREFFITAGARMDYHSIAGLTVSPRAALVWEFGPPTEEMADGRLVSIPGQSVRATASCGFRDPSLRDLWFNMTLDPAGMSDPLPVTVVGNKDLRPEEIRSFEIGYWGRPTSRLQAESSVFYNLTDHLFAFEANPNGTASRHNVHKEDTYGIELSLEYQLTGEVYTFANYAYEVRQDRDTHDSIPDAPRNKANVGVRVITPKSLSGMLWVNYFDHVRFTTRTGKDTTTLGSVPAYTLVNAKVWYPIRVGKAEGKIFLEAFNLLNNVHREYIDTEPYGIIASAGFELAW